MKTFFNFFKKQLAIFIAIYTLLAPLFVFLMLQHNSDSAVMTQDGWLVVNAIVATIGFWYVWIAPKIKANKKAR